MPKPLRLLTHRLGQRGEVLLLLGAIWALIGVVDSFEKEIATSDQSVGLFHAYVPYWWVTWFIAGVVALVAAFLDRARRDVWGFLALFVPPALQCMSYLWASFVWLLSGGGMGFGRGALLVIVWGLVALLPYTLSGWAEPDNGEA